MRRERPSRSPRRKRRRRCRRPRRRPRRRSARRRRRSRRRPRPARPARGRRRDAARAAVRRAAVPVLAHAGRDADVRDVHEDDDVAPGRRHRHRAQGRRALLRPAPGELRQDVHRRAVHRARRRRRGVRGPRVRAVPSHVQARRQARSVDHAEHALRRRQGQRRGELARDQRRRLGDPLDADRRRGSRARSTSSSRRRCSSPTSKASAPISAAAPRRRRCPGCCCWSSRPSFSVDATKSYYLSTKAFPRNDEISVNLAFNGPPNALPTVPDGRGIPIGVHYSIVAPPERDAKFVPRLADDRVGYFITARKRYGNDRLGSPFERFIERWNLDNGPITFYLTNEIPAEYRGTVRRGDPRVERHVREDRPSQRDRREGPAVRTRLGSRRRALHDRSLDHVGPAELQRVQPARERSRHGPDHSRRGRDRRRVAALDQARLHRPRAARAARARQRVRARRRPPRVRIRTRPTAIPRSRAAKSARWKKTPSRRPRSGSMLLAQNPRVDAGRPRALRAGVAVRHRHARGRATRWGCATTSRARRSSRCAQLHDPAFTRAHGTTASVMDYMPANIAAPGERQADYFPTRLGTYDYWAIEYGYRSFPNVHSSADEAVPLSRIAARSTEPGHAYGTDEDATSISIDPRIQRFDLSNDPLAYVDEQFRVDADVAARLTRRYPGDTPHVPGPARRAHHGAQQPAQRRGARGEVRRRHLHVARAPRPAGRAAAVHLDPARAAAPRVRSARPLDPLVARAAVLAGAAQRGRRRRASGCTGARTASGAATSRSAR